MKHPQVEATLAVLFCVSLLGQTAFNPPPGPPRTREGLRLAERGRHAMVACADPVATQVGVEVLKSGGNAMDAAIAVGFALAVTMPSAGNLGGGGMMLVYRADGRCEAVDYREMLPSAARPEDYARPEDRSIGVRSVGVPGTVAALGTAHQRHGRKRWAHILEPARRLAAEGVRISRTLGSTLAGASKRLSVSGSARIPNVLMQMIVNVVDFKLGVRDAVDAPRLHQELSTEALAEAGALSSDAIQELRKRGHEITCRKSPLGDVHALLIDEQGWRYGWSDGRSGGRALGY